jgi:hypothetical protein
MLPFYDDCGTTGLPSSRSLRLELGGRLCFASARRSRHSPPLVGFTKPLRGLKEPPLGLNEPLPGLSEPLLTSNERLLGLNEPPVGLKGRFLVSTSPPVV